MSNTKGFRLIADVPFHYLDQLPDADALLVARVLLAPATGLVFAYAGAGSVPNPDGSNGRTHMYRITVEGVEALRWETLERLALIFKNCSPAAVLHMAEARDLDAGSGSQWAHVVNRAELCACHQVAPVLQLVGRPRRAGS